jgi:hypothetical protein
MFHWTNLLYIEICTFNGVLYCVRVSVVLPSQLSGTKLKTFETSRLERLGPSDVRPQASNLGLRFGLTWTWLFTGKPGFSSEACHLVSCMFNVKI